MRDITCTLCGCTIKYDEYKEQLRAPTFRGVVCPHCGSDQNVRFTVCKATGRKCDSTFVSPVKQRKNKTERSESCRSCGTYWAETGSFSMCPFCGKEVTESAYVDKREVGGADFVSPFLRLLMNIEDKKLELLRNQTEIENVHSNALGCLLAGMGEDGFNISGLCTAYARADKTASQLRGQTKFIIATISKLERKIKF